MAVDRDAADRAGHGQCRRQTVALDREIDPRAAPRRGSSGTHRTVAGGKQECRIRGPDRSRCGGAVGLARAWEEIGTQAKAGGRTRRGPSGVDCTREHPRTRRTLTERTGRRHWAAHLWTAEAANPVLESVRAKRR